MAAAGPLDRWSDIDLALSVSPDAAIEQVIGDWTATMYREHDAIAHLDLRRGNILPPQAPAELIGMAWLYALHARSSIARGRLWQAEYMLSAMRDRVLALACVRHGLNSRDARGVDDLPDEFKSSLISTLVWRMEADRVKRAFSVVITALLDETRHVDPALAERLSPTLILLDD